CLGRAGDACVVGALERVGDTVYGARVYVKLGRRLAHAHAARQSCSDSLSQLVRDWRPAKAFTFTLGPLEASAHALLNDRALELGKDAQHLKHRLAGRRGRIETLLMQKQVDAERVKLGQERHKVFCHRPTPPSMKSRGRRGLPDSFFECGGNWGGARSRPARRSLSLPVRWRFLLLSRYASRARLVNLRHTFFLPFHPSH